VNTAFLLSSYAFYLSPYSCVEILLCKRVSVRSGITNRSIEQQQIGHDSG